MDTSPAIGFWAGLMHCFHTSSYWICLASLLVALTIIYALIKRWANKSNTDPSKVLLVFTIVSVMFFFLFLLMRPCSVGFNTSVEMAAKGEYLGY